MYNLRYHIASLVAVFLSLALGLVLGGLVVQQGTFDRQQKAIVAGLQRDFARLNSDNKELSAESEMLRGYASQMTSAWTSGRLKGRSVVVLTSGDKNEGLQSAIASIQDAGGTAAVVTLAKKNFGLGDAKIEDAARSVIGTTTDLGTGVEGALTAEWTQPLATRPLTDALVRAGAITVTGMKPSVAATQALDIAAFGRKPDQTALGIAQAYADAGFYAVGAQTVSSGTGVAAAASALKLSAFDTLGTEIGRFTLVALFTGGQQGYFSVADRASSPYPPVPRP